MMEGLTFPCTLCNAPVPMEQSLAVCASCCVRHGWQLPQKDNVPPADLSTVEMGVFLAASVKAALKNSVRHYDRQDRLMTDPLEVLLAMRQGAIRVDETDRKKVTSVEIEFTELIMNPSIRNKVFADPASVRSRAVWAEVQRITGGMLTNNN